MLSPKQKKTLFGASIESRPRYVRVPLQMVNSVRELNTDVNFARLVAQFEQTDDRLRSSTDEPIAHIRLDASGARGNLCRHEAGPISSAVAPQRVQTLLGHGCAHLTNLGKSSNALWAHLQLWSRPMRLAGPGDTGSLEKRAFQGKQTSSAHSI